MNPLRRVLLSVPHMSGVEQKYVEEAFASNWLSTVGPHITALEAEFESRLGLPVVAVSSGTAAIHLGLRLLGVGPGDEVLCPTLTFVATANPIKYLGAQPIFIDSERLSWNMDPGLLHVALKERSLAAQLPKAVVVVHLFGQCADMDPILEVCGQFGVPVLEDAAEALGSTYKGRPAGTFGEVAIFSLNGNKIITSSGGGILVTRNRSHADRARFWAAQAKNPGIGYEHSDYGYNYGLSNVLAAIARGQLQVSDLRVQQRRQVFELYQRAFADLPGIEPMPEAAWGMSNRWLSCFLIDAPQFGCTRDELVSLLDRAGIESRPTWKPMHLQPLFAEAVRYGGGVAEELSQSGICLPSSSSLSQSDQMHVISTVCAVCRGKSAAELSSHPQRRLASETARGNTSTAPPAERIQLREPSGRASVDPSRGAAFHKITGRTIVVTGAAGSMGAELCRQIALLGPRKLVAFDISEAGLFHLERELRQVPGLEFHIELGNMQNSTRVLEVLQAHKPSLLYHAAAYKHVPMMENHPFEAVENNIFGTLHVLTAALECGVGDLLLISSDKAVRPSSIMGATKRVAEMMLTSLGDDGTRLMSVRLGNVLESSGSVIPIFKEQIAGGGPITVTHPEMSRYLMSIEDACGLILKASEMGVGNDRFLLDFGEPVRISELAENLIRRSGLRLDHDIRIVFSGARPGEKLSEEFLADGETPQATGHEKVRLITGGTVLPSGFREHLDRLKGSCDVRDLGEMIRILRMMVPDYVPSPEILARAGLLTVSRAN